MKYGDYVKKVSEGDIFDFDRDEPTKPKAGKAGYKPPTEKVLKVAKMTGKDMDECAAALINTSGDISKAIDMLGKKKKEKKIFQVGDIVVRTKMDKGKMTDDCMEFLRTYKWFKILHVNENHNIDIGYLTPAGKTFMFSPNNFELRDPKPIETKIVEQQPPKPPRKQEDYQRIKKDDIGWGDDDDQLFKPAHD